jgi:maltokinase
VSWSEAGPIDAELPVSTYPALRELVAAFASHRTRWDSEDDGAAAATGGGGGGDGGSVGEDLPDVSPESVTIRSADVVRPGRPGLVSVIAEVPGRLVHAVLGLRSPGDEVQFLAGVDDSPLGIFEDGDGLAVVFDATADSELMLCLLEAVGGASGDYDRVRRIAITDDTVSVTFDDRVAFTIYQQLPADLGPHPGLELFLGLDAVGFNHLLAPIAVWRRGRTDLGIVREYQTGNTGGWSLALTSLRDLYAAGGEPERAGGDFAAEARRLGTMTARMHLGLDEAFGLQLGDIAAWVNEVEEAVRLVDPGLLSTDTVATLLAELRSSNTRCAAIRTHGDFHLGRVSRNDLGWYVLDFSPGGRSETTAGVMTADGAEFRSPMADVADMLWSFHHVAVVAATERDPYGRLGLSELGHAWEIRNRRAFLAEYLATPGIGALVPPSRDMVRNLAAAFELERSASMMARA